MAKTKVVKDKKLKCGCVVTAAGVDAKGCANGKWHPPEFRVAGQVGIVDLCTKQSDEWLKRWRAYICPTCKVKGFAPTKSSHKQGCSEIALAKRHGVGLLDWAKACRSLSGWEGEEVRCVLPKGHGGIHQWPTTEVERIEQLKRGNLQSLIDEAKQERQQVKTMAAKNVTKTETKGKTAAKGKAAVGGKKGNPAALAKAREASAGAREEARKRKITLVEKANPKREGSAAYDKYELYRKSKTVGDFLDAGGTSADLAWDQKHEFIKVQ